MEKMDDQAMENVPEDDDTGECCLYLVYLHVGLHKVLIQITICLLQVKKWMTKQWKIFQKVTARHLQLQRTEQASIHS